MSVTSMFLDKFKVGSEVYNLININYKPTQEKETKSIEQIHHIHVIDRSYSMSSDIDRLIDNVKSTLDFVGENDLVSVVWFASENQCKVLFKGTNVHSKDIINKKLDSIRSCVGCTCFSEPLKLVEEVILDLKDICPNFNICFFTDGETVTNWTSDEEKERIFNILEKLNKENQLLALNTIGYGNYYDEFLLNEMCKYSSFGTFNHSKDIEDYSKIFTHEYEKIKDNVSQTCTINAKNADIVYLSPKDSNMYTNEFHTNTVNKIKNQFFIITKEDEFEIDGKVYNVTNLSGNTRHIPKPSYLNFLYSYGKELYKRGNQHKAIDVLVHTKDKNILDIMINSFTRDERADVVNKIAECYVSNKNRYKTGEVEEDYVPKADAYNVITLLSELSNVKAIYYPTTEYNRIGREVNYLQNLFKKNNDMEVSSPMDELVFNEKKLNVSIRYKIEGYVNIDPQLAQSVGLDEKQNCHIYRMQTIIKDRYLNVSKIKVKVNDTYLSKEAKSIIEKSTIKLEDGYRTCEIDLSTLPVTNRQSSDLTTSDILSLTKRLVELKSMQKALRSLEKKVDKRDNNSTHNPFLPKSKNEYTEEQIEVLKQHGVSVNGSYTPIVQSYTINENDEHYETRIIEFAIKGCSSIPKIEDSLSKKEKGKKLNLMDESIISVLDMYNEDINPILLNTQLLSTKEQITKISALLFAAKVSKVLTGGWWDNLTTTNKAEEYKENDITLLIKTKREKVYL